MKKLFFFFLSIAYCLLPTFSFSQYIFNSCNSFPAYGDSMIVTVQQYDTTWLSSETSGANVIWNYNPTLISTQIVSHYYFVPTATSGSSMFPNSNLADSTNDGWTSYYNHSQDSITYFGSYKDANSFNGYWDSQKKIICPLNFSNSYSDFFSWHSGLFCPVHHDYINRTVMYDAYGTLNLLKKTYQAARIKTFSSGIDSLVCFPSIARFDIEDTTFIWYDINNGMPILQYEYYNQTDTTSTSFINKFFSVFTYSHLPVIVTDVPTLSNEESISVFPSPSADGRLLVSGLQSPGQIRIYNLLGEKVFESKTVNSKHETINLDEVNGIYFLQIKTEKESITKKIIISR